MISESSANQSSTTPGSLQSSRSDDIENELFVCLRGFVSEVDDNDFLANDDDDDDDLDDV